jgi:hypothetical protein
LESTTTNANANTDGYLGALTNTHKNTDTPTEQDTDADRYLGPLTHAHSDSNYRAD